MTYSYEWLDAEQITLKRTSPDGKVAYVPNEPHNVAFAEYLNSGAQAAPYVPPEPAPEKTTEEKVDQLLSDYGLTREEMRAALAVKTE